VPLGAGHAPAGTCPAGYGVIDVAPAPNLTALPDPKTGLSQTGRYLNAPNAQTGKGMDYSFSADGRVQGMPTVYQMVLIAIENANFTQVQEKGPQWKTQLRTIVQNAVAYLVTSKQLQVKSIVVIDGMVGQNPDGAIAILNWFDVTMGQNGEPVRITP
jgi:hypothetical protein